MGVTFTGGNASHAVVTSSYVHADPNTEIYHRFKDRFPRRITPFHDNSLGGLQMDSDHAVYLSDPDINGVLCSIRCRL